MCGIAGWICHREDISQRKEEIVRMTSALAPRGPDAEGYRLGEHALLGHRRLVVVDPEGGGQPMTRTHNGQTYTLVYNGELYNTEEVRARLFALGFTFQGHSDTEVALCAYIAWGPDCARYFNGIYALGVWEECSQTLCLIRDRFGVKPLFYAAVNDSLLFASELKALLAHGLVRPTLDAEGLAEVFALGPSRSPGSGVYRDVHELLPAHYLVYTPEGLKTGKYWELVSAPHTEPLEQTIERVRFLVQDTIERQLVSDVPVCTFLSGGLDSSAITAIAARHFAQRGEQLHTFSIDYAGNDRFFHASRFQPNSDAEFVRLMTQRLGTEHHYITINSPAVLADALLDATRARDLPGMADVDSSLLLFCREIKKTHVVSLSGECADEVFGGYPWFHMQQPSDTFPWMRNIDEKMKIFAPELLKYMRPIEYIHDKYTQSVAQCPRLEGEDELEARRRELFFLNINWFMTTLLDRKDRMSMATGLEVRVPYCDHRLVEYVWNIPWAMKTVNDREKGILREALRGLLPDEVLFRKKSPYPKTHNPVYEEIVRERFFDTLDSSPLRPLLNQQVIQQMAREETDYGNPWFGQLMARPQLWAFLLQCDCWMRENHVVIV